MLHRTLFVALVMLVSAGHASAYVWITNPDNGHTYTQTDQSGTWAEAEQEAQAAGGHLVSISNAAENTWLVNNIGNGPGNALWIGLEYDGVNDYGQQSSWSWADGSSVDYWHNPPPHTGAHAYVHTLNHSFPYEWRSNVLHDNPSDPANHFRGIIEVPEPSTLLLTASGLCLLALRRRRQG